MRLFGKERRFPRLPAIPPTGAAFILLLAGLGNLIAGVYLLVGLAWALVAAGAAFLWLAMTLFRGAARVE